MRRFTQRHPGYDCKFAPCQHTPKGNDHGWSGGKRWHAVVADEGDIAVVLFLTPHVFPTTVPEELRRRVEKERLGDGSDISAEFFVHRSFPIDAEEVLGTSGSEKCEFLPGGRCYGHGGGGFAEAAKLVRECYGPELDEIAFALATFDYEPREGLWRALEAKLAEEVVELRPQNAEGKIVVCEHCAGKGTRRTS
jgi:hypothetical protein